MTSLITAVVFCDCGPGISVYLNCYTNARALRADEYFLYNLMYDLETSLGQQPCYSVLTGVFEGKIRIGNMPSRAPLHS